MQANSLEWVVQEVSSELPATTVLVQACSTLTLPSPMLHLNTLTLPHTPHLWGVQVYDLTFKKNKNKTVKGQHHGDPKFPRLTQTRVPSAPATPNHPGFLRSHVQHRCWGGHAPAHCPERSSAL